MRKGPVAYGSLFNFVRPCCLRREAARRPEAFAHRREAFAHRREASALHREASAPADAFGSADASREVDCDADASHFATAWNPTEAACDG